MIADEVKRDKSNGFPVEETTGCCKFCKQLINIHIQDYRTEWTEKNWQQNYAAVSRH